MDWLTNNWFETYITKVMTVYLIFMLIRHNKFPKEKYAYYHNIFRQSFDSKTPWSSAFVIQYTIDCQTQFQWKLWDVIHPLPGA